MDKTLIGIYYRNGIFTNKDLDIFVKSGDITEQEKIQIQNNANMAK